MEMPDLPGNSTENVLIWTNRSGPPIALSRARFTDAQLACSPLRYGLPELKPPKTLVSQELVAMLIILSIVVMVLAKLENWINLRRQNNGCVFYSVNMAVAASAFSLVLIEMRTKAPGAKTFPQVVRRRFGNLAHIVTTCIFLFTSFVNVFVIITVGASALSVVCTELEGERLVAFLFLTVGVWNLCSEDSGLQISTYFSSVFVLISTGILSTLVFQNKKAFPLGSVDRVHKLLQCVHGPTDQMIERYMSAYNPHALMPGITHMLMVWTSFFANQSYWITSADVPPDNCSLGLLITAVVNFTTSMIFSTSLGLGIVALQSAYGDAIWQAYGTADYMKPYIVPTFILGRSGLTLTALLILVLTVTAASNVVLGGSIIIYHDILVVYLKVSELFFIY
ncbi:unnamed protein product [Schistocephalus solidus]|uniref:Uncharacterized protein n=1 Tax=Schistocephalus solidus TaxID=70667 RepID=A0A183T0M6_SCHSO|nr:unnamed protein product [Schistocephalus solidus]